MPVLFFSKEDIKPEDAERAKDLLDKGKRNDKFLNDFLNKVNDLIRLKILGPQKVKYFNKDGTSNERIMINMEKEESLPFVWMRLIDWDKKRTLFSTHLGNSIHEYCTEWDAEHSRYATPKEKKLYDEQHKDDPDYDKRKHRKIYENNISIDKSIGSDGEGSNITLGDTIKSEFRNPEEEFIYTEKNRENFVHMLKRFDERIYKGSKLDSSLVLGILLVEFHCYFTFPMEDMKEELKNFEFVGLLDIDDLFDKYKKNRGPDNKFFASYFNKAESKVSNTKKSAFEKLT